MGRQKDARKHSRRSEGGFTIIEVMLVLVIAAVIILIVFLAVPALQRNARNVRRRRDVAYLLPVVREAKVNNNNKFPDKCNNGQNYCFLYNQPLSYYSNNGSTSARTVSFFPRPTPWGEAPADNQLDPNDTSVYGPDGGSHATTWQNTEIVQIRSFTKCAANGEFTGDGAKPDDLAAQFVIETGGDGQLQCVEG